MNIVITKNSKSDTISYFLQNIEKKLLGPIIDDIKASMKRVEAMQDKLLEPFIYPAKDWVFF